ncbi:hypothetical protein [Kocuria sp. TGY1127_2]|uniref:hypothetical protein n=1 Tax=Kocuria sp. TGY1127_2 TaxID=2711328 RepID=UPI0015B8E995|nr:hypothetical protein [Kocuria sp. TGY1127_2]
MNTPTSLRELAEKAVADRGLSGRRLAFLAQDHGFELTHTTFNHLRAGTYKAHPSEDTLRALAWLAGVHEDVAFTLAGRPTPGPPLAEELPPGSDNLSPKARKVVIDLLRVLVTAEQGVDDRGNTTPITQAGQPPAQPNYQPGPDEAIGPGEAGYLAPPENYEYDLAADNTSSEGQQLRGPIDEIEEEGNRD